MCIGTCSRATRMTNSGTASFGSVLKPNERDRLRKMTAARLWAPSATNLRSASPMHASRPRRKSARSLKFGCAALVLVLVAGCKPPSLPDSRSPGAQVYINRCGNCHVPYNPHEMTASMWDTQATMMEVKIQDAGLPPLTSDEREAILDDR